MGLVTIYIGWGDFNITKQTHKTTHYALMIGKKEVNFHPHKSCLFIIPFPDVNSDIPYTFLIWICVFVDMKWSNPILSNLHLSVPQD